MQSARFFHHTFYFFLFVCLFVCLSVANPINEFRNWQRLPIPKRNDVNPSNVGGKKIDWMNLSVLLINKHDKVDNLLDKMVNNIFWWIYQKQTQNYISDACGWQTRWYYLVIRTSGSLCNSWKYSVNLFAIHTIWFLLNSIQYLKFGTLIIAFQNHTYANNVQVT